MLMLIVLIRILWNKLLTLPHPLQHPQSPGCLGVKCFLHTSCWNILICSWWGILTTAIYRPSLMWYYICNIFSLMFCHLKNYSLSALWILHCAVINIYCHEFAFCAWPLALWLFSVAHGWSCSFENHILNNISVFEMCTLSCFNCMWWYCTVSWISLSDVRDSGFISLFSHLM
jgi:hypothetical protein